jgi:hypothetical protein
VWLLIATLGSARLCWLQCHALVAECLLNSQGLQLWRESILPEAWHRCVQSELGFEPPSGRVRGCVNIHWVGSSDITDLTPLARFPQLEMLCIHQTDHRHRLNASAQCTLERLGSFPALRRFVINIETSLPDEYFRRFADSPDLETLCVIDRQLTDSGLRHLASCRKLKSLYIVDSQVHRALNELSVRNLRRLSASRTCIDSAGMEGLRNASSLESVSLDGTDVDDCGMVVLSSLSSLEFVCLDQTHVTRDGLALLMKLPKLTWIAACGTSVAVDDAVELTRGRGTTIVVGTAGERIHVTAGAVRQ